MSIEKSQSQENLQELETVGKWSSEENLDYLMFLELNKRVFLSKRKSRATRIFDRMAEYIPARTSMQCRNHHQKVMAKFLTLRNAIDYIRSTFSTPVLLEASNKARKDSRARVNPKTDLDKKKESKETTPCEQGDEDSLASREGVKLEAEADLQQAKLEVVKTESIRSNEGPYGVYMPNPWPPGPYFYPFYPGFRPGYFHL